MKNRLKTRLFACIAVATVGMSVEAQILDVQVVQDLSGVSVSYHGSIDTTGLTYWFTTVPGPGWLSFQAGPPSALNALVFNDGATNVDLFSAVSSVLGTSDGGSIQSTGFAGSPFGFVGISEGSPPVLSVVIGVPEGYASGTTISGQMQFAGSTLGNFSMIDGSFQTLNLPGGNTVTISASIAPVPEPSEWAALGAGLCGVVAVVRRMRMKAPPRP